MTPISLSDLENAVDGQLVSCADPSAMIRRVVIDSRQVVPGDLFWALKGEHHDGHDFVGDVFSRGALAAVVRSDRLADGRWLKADGFRPGMIAVGDTQTALEAFARWYRSRHESLVVGVTGSFGKTTTREMIHAVLSARHSGVRSLKNFNNHIGLPLSLLELDESHDFAVLEMGASAVGEIAALAEIAKPQIGVITGIGLAHVEGFGSPERIVLGKGELLEALPSSGYAVLPGDDPVTRGMSGRTRANALFIGEQSDNHLIATNIGVEPQRLTFRVDGFDYSVPVIGRHFLRAALTALAIGREFGLSPNEINEGFQNFQTVVGRCQVQQIGRWIVIDDSYNANPESMRAACETLRDWQTDRRRMFIAGDMLELGKHADQSHFEVGLAAAQAGIDLLLAYGNHADDMIRGALSAGFPEDRLVHTDNFDNLLDAIDRLIAPEDVLLVKGSRGMRMERVVDWLRGQVKSNGA